MGTIYGVVLHEGEPTSGVQVRLADSDGNSIGETQSQQDGAFTFEASGGVWTLQWTSLDGSINEGQVEVPKGEDAEIEIEI